MGDANDILPVDSLDNHDIECLTHIYNKFIKTPKYNDPFNLDKFSEFTPSIHLRNYYRRYPCLISNELAKLLQLPINTTMSRMQGYYKLLNCLNNQHLLRYDDNPTIQFENEEKLMDAIAGNSGLGPSLNVNCTGLQNILSIDILHNYRGKHDAIHIDSVTEDIERHHYQMILPRGQATASPLLNV